MNKTGPQTPNLGDLFLSPTCKHSSSGKERNPRDRRMSTVSSSASSSAGASSYSNASSSSSYFPMPFHLQQPPYLPVPPSVQYPAPPPPVNVPVPSVFPSYSIPQYQQVQHSHQLFQKDMQTINPEALENVKAAIASSEIEHKAETKKKAIPRKAAGQAWEDPTLAEWPENDYRLFCGDLGNEVNDDVLSKAFSRFPSFNLARLQRWSVADGGVGGIWCFMAVVGSVMVVVVMVLDMAVLVVISLDDETVVRDKRTGKTKGYGFVSFANPSDLAAALKEMNGKYVGNRPIKLRKSNWRERTDHEALERQKNHTQKKSKLSKKSVLHK
ncbi:hypothetical protein RJ639_000030 [Escallonia herrerae]|uniref:RRM domain-containing protein n=1 Tax=Escallonia herrerae TaxID=1293975 RepID=A0AA89BTE0_9ASTE|nr:hypothetical protein RJ639_000030 [Escallonia herrerae]